MVQRFRKFISTNNLVSQGSKILLAVSGGIDSMVMTHLFMQEDYKIGIAHCNFSLRASESDLDEKMVSEFASAQNIEFFSIRFNTKEYAVENGISIQMAARELRYSWFEKIRYDHGYDAVAVAHNMNDNIETLLINLIRGTGITGLTGMKPETNYIIRPLLFATRDEITNYCNNNMVVYREDRSNADTKYLRNKIRHQVLPLLKEMNPSIESSLNETAGILSGINEIVSDYVKNLREELSEQKDDYIAYNIGRLNPYLHNRALLFEIFRPYGIADVSIKDLLSIIEGETGGQLYTTTHRIVRNRKELLVTGHKKVEINQLLINNSEELKKIPHIESVAVTRITEAFVIPSGPGSLCIDYDKISYPLVLRRWNSGDYFYPLGFNHKKKLSDYFTDRKYSILDKDNAQILESEGMIVCILGDRIDNRFRITSSSENALIIISGQKDLLCKQEL
ncbi:MAG: tRNA lysidine(34) synthetase TilS [Bacteroidales bacterium]|nr:tRNA lysidine(34) synthetase TilS [Bacteroidales bacterium]